jgi:hypothetical protein
MTQDLYTADGVRKVKELLLQEQGGKCAILGIDIEERKRTAVLDHAHDEEQFVRSVLEREANAFLGVIENAHRRFLGYWCEIPLAEVLRRTADYLELEQDTRWRHPGWLKKVSASFNKLNTKQQSFVLEYLGYPAEKNPLKRKAIFRKASLDRNLGYDKIRDAIEKAKTV